MKVQRGAALGQVVRRSFLCLMLRGLGGGQSHVNRGSWFLIIRLPGARRCLLRRTQVLLVLRPLLLCKHLRRGVRLRGSALWTLQPKKKQRDNAHNLEPLSFEGSG